jgi:hypothetical protein
MPVSSRGCDGRAVNLTQTGSLRFLGLPVVALFVAALAGCAGGGSATPASSTTGSSTSGVGPASASPTTGSASPAAAPSNVAAVPAESNPPGDIPDNLAFVRYRNSPGGYTFRHPEGWAQTGSGTAVNFTDKLNGVTVDSAAATSAPTVASARSTDLARLQQSVPAFHLSNVTAVSLPGGTGVRIVFRRNSDADPVTGKVYRDEVEEYLVFGSGRLVRMDLYGPVGADNVDAYRTMSQSLRIR